MGQHIVVEAVATVDDVAIFETDRSLTGMDPEVFESLPASDEDLEFPGELARRLFAGDAAVRRVFLAGNAVVVRREGGWPDGERDAAASTIGDLLLFY